MAFNPRDKRLLAIIDDKLLKARAQWKRYIQETRGAAAIETMDVIDQLLDERWKIQKAPWEARFGG